MGSVLLSGPGPVPILTLSRPEKRNSLDLAMLDLFSAAVSGLRGREGTRVLVVRGEGGAFCAGADLSVLGGLDPRSAREFARRGQEACASLEELPFPVLAAVDGPCVGGGLELALSCDLILASEGAVFRAPEVAHGFPTGWGGSIRLPRRVGLGRAKDILLTARPVPAAEALAIGLADRVLPAAGFEKGVLALAADLADKAPLALSLVKTVIQRGLDGSFETGLALEREAFAFAFTSEDAREGVRAFLEKRPPRFTGR